MKTRGAKILAAASGGGEVFWTVTALGISEACTLQLPAELMLRPKAVAVWYGLKFYRVRAQVHRRLQRLCSFDATN